MSCIQVSEYKVLYIYYIYIYIYINTSSIKIGARFELTELAVCDQTKSFIGSSYYGRDRRRRVKQLS